jgi:hypothetical protein
MLTYTSWIDGEETVAVSALQTVNEIDAPRAFTETERRNARAYLRTLIGA